MIEFAEEYGKEFNLKLVDQFEKMGEEKYGTAMPVAATKEAVGDENFVVINGDDLYAVEDLKNERIDDKLSYAGGMPTDDPSPYGIFKTNDAGYLEK